MGCYLRPLLNRLIGASNETEGNGAETDDTYQPCGFEEVPVSEGVAVASDDECKYSSDNVPDEYGVQQSVSEAERKYQECYPSEEKCCGHLLILSYQLILGHKSS